MRRDWERLWRCVEIQGVEEKPDFEGSGMEWRSRLHRAVGAEKQWEGSESGECRWTQDCRPHIAVDQASASATRVDLLVLVAASSQCSLPSAVLMVSLDWAEKGCESLGRGCEYRR